MTIRLIKSLPFVFLLIQAGMANAAALYEEDISVQGNFCLGVDCLIQPEFPFPVIKLTENNTRIAFFDSSADASGDEWRLVANDSNSGGKDLFRIHSESVTGIVLTVDSLDAETPMLGSVALGVIDNATNSNSPAYPDGTVSIGKDADLRRLVHLSEALSASDLLIRKQMDGLPVSRQLERLAEYNKALDLVEGKIELVERIVKNRDQYEGKQGGAFWIALFLPLLCFRKK